MDEPMTPPAPAEPMAPSMPSEPAMPHDDGGMPQTPPAAVDAQ